MAEGSRDASDGTRMNGVHDMGGMQDFGPVVPEKDEPSFHHAWERRAFALTLAMGATGAWNLDQARSARESLPPAQYLASSYYEIWLARTRPRSWSSDISSRRTKLPGGRMAVAPRPLPRRLEASAVAATLARGASTLRDAARLPARFAPGDRVRTRNVHPASHTRLPRYCRGKPGTVVAVHGAHVYPDANARGSESPQWLYTVRFEARDLWGPDTTATAVSRRLLRAVPGMTAERVDLAAVADAPRDGDGPGVQRAVGSAGVRARGGAVRARRLHVEGMGRDAGRGDRRSAGARRA